MEKNGIEKILQACDKVIANPKQSIYTLTNSKTRNTIGVLVAVNVISPIAASPLLIGGGMLFPVPAIALLIYKYFKRNGDLQEKDKMYREIIKKQQAVIRELEKRDRLSSEEIKNLKETLEMLEQLEKTAA